MTYKGGTPEARACISKLQELGALVDVYSSQWLDIHQHFSLFDRDDLIEYQKQSINACEGHLLIISTSLDELTTSTLLTAAHKPFGEILDPGTSKHKPDLILINLATKQILCIGLGRKNYFFGFAVGFDNVRLSDGNIYDVMRWAAENKISELEAESDPTYAFIREFVKFDYAGIVSSLLESLYEFGVYARGWDYLPLNPDDVELIIQTGPDVDGFYDIDGEFKSIEEAKDIIKEFKEYDDLGNDSLMSIQFLFPELTWGDLNTQDY